MSGSVAVTRARERARRLALLAAFVSASGAPGCCPGNDVREVHVHLPTGWHVEGRNLINPDGDSFGPSDSLPGDDCEAICGGSDCVVAYQCQPTGEEESPDFSCDPSSKVNPYALEVICTVSYEGACGDQ